MTYPTTRKEAKATGAAYYYTGAACKHGHLSKRKTKGSCVECDRLYQIADGPRRAALPKSEASKEAGRRYYEKNREEMLAKAASQSPADRRRYRNAWKLRNPDEAQAMSNAYKRRTRHATPKWLTSGQRKQISEIYLAARQLTKTTGVKYTVDHIEPLRGANVCGLHVPWNLQILTHEANCRKNNKSI
jgi:hypothetical protein